VLFLCVFVAAGFTKDSMKLVQVYRTTERYEQSSNTAAIINAKYQSVFLPVYHVRLITTETSLVPDSQKKS